MNTENELLAQFEVEELEQRFEMGWGGGQFNPKGPN